MKIKVYDKVKWHYPEGKNCPSLEAAMRHFIFIMNWLNSNNLLSDHGKELFELGIDEDFSLNSTLLTEKGVALLDNCYEKWQQKLTYVTPVSGKILDEALKTLE